MGTERLHDRHVLGMHLDRLGKQLLERRNLKCDHHAQRHDGGAANNKPALMICTQVVATMPPKVT